MLTMNASIGEQFSMPDVSGVFASAATYRPVSATAAKLAGAGDSVRDQKSDVKAPGGKDAAKQKDGG